jgi:hypothetical protein
MTPLRRTFTVLAVIAGLVVFGGAATVPVVQAQSGDQQFEDQVTALEIPFAPDEDLPAVGHSVCEMLNGGLAGNPNPVPVVRGVVQRLENSGMNKQQAVGLMRAAVAAYCPQHARFMGR